MESSLINAGDYASFSLVGNLIVAFAPTFIILLVGRILSALAHGIFMSVSTVIAADVVLCHHVEPVPLLLCLRG